MTRRTLAVLGALAAALALTTAAGAQSSAGSLVGAGSSFVAPLVSAWIPKVDSAFVEGGGKRALIASLEAGLRALAGQAGTEVSN